MACTTVPRGEKGSYYYIYDGILPFCAFFRYGTPPPSPPACFPYIQYSSTVAATRTYLSGWVGKFIPSASNGVGKQSVVVRWGAGTRVVVGVTVGYCKGPSPKNQNYAEREKIGTICY